MSITPKNWASFQHYKDRSPAWIKLHRGLLDDFAFSRLPVASRALAPLLWLLASESEDGCIDASNEEIAYRLRMPEKELVAALNPLIQSGFFISDSAPLADCKRDASLEKERETQDKTEEEYRPVAKATRPTNADFEDFWKAYPKRKGENPKEPARKLFEAAVRQGTDPPTIIRGVKAAADRHRDKVGTEFIPQAVKWLRDKRWQEYETTGPPVAMRLLQPGSDEWKAEREAKVARGESTALMDRQAERGVGWAVTENEAA